MVLHSVILWYSSLLIDYLKHFGSYYKTYTPRIAKQNRQMLTGQKTCTTHIHIEHAGFNNCEYESTVKPWSETSHIQAHSVLNLRQYSIDG